MATDRGFTLIELLFVVAIIALLSSIILGSLQTARLKGADAAVRQQVHELHNLMELERSGSGTYSAIKSGGAWKAAGAACSPSAFSGAYGAQAAQACTSLVRSAGRSCAANCAYFGAVNVSGMGPGQSNPSTRFTIMAYLPYASMQAGSAQYLCVGSSGGMSVTPFNQWTAAGCYNNP